MGCFVICFFAKITKEMNIILFGIILLGIIPKGINQLACQNPFLPAGADMCYLEFRTPYLPQNELAGFFTFRLSLSLSAHPHEGNKKVPLD
jgi:hypothetical protein